MPLTPRHALCTGRSEMGMQSIGQPSRSPGFALVAVLWMLAALSLLVMGMIAASRTEIRSHQAWRDALEATYIGDAAIILAIQAELADTADSNRLRRHVVEFEGRRVLVRFVPATGLIDLNTAPAALLAALFRQVGGLMPEEAASLAEQVAAWRNQGDPEDLSVGSRRKRQFEVIEDLLQVPGFPFELFDNIQHFVTTFSRSAGIEPLSAPLPVLEVLAETAPGAARDIARRRDAADPIIDMTALDTNFIVTASTRIHRLDADVVVPGGRTLRRSAWVTIGGQPADQLPWRVLDQRPVFALVGADT